MSNTCEHNTYTYKTLQKAVDRVDSKTKGDLLSQSVSTCGLPAQEQLPDGRLFCYKHIENYNSMMNNQNSPRNK